MGAHFSSKHCRRKLTMISKVAVLCLLATLAQAAPEAQWLGHHAPLAYAAPDCAHSTQDLVAKTCHPVAKEICTEETAINQKIEYEEVCEDVVSKHCGHHQTLCPITHLRRCAHPNHQMPRRRAC